MHQRWAGTVAEDALRRAAQTLVEVSADGLAVVDGAGRFAGLNHSGAALLGAAPEDLLGRPAPFARHPGPDRVLHTATWTAPGGRAQDLEYRILPLPDGGHAVWFRDVTTVRRQQRRLTAIARAASRVAEAYSLPVTLEAVAQEIVRTANIAAVQILSVEDPSAELRILGMAGFGTAPDFVARLSACRRRGAHVRFLDAFLSGEPVVDLRRKPLIMSDPAWAPLKEIMDRPDWDAFVSMPMSVRGRTVGVINAYYRPGEDPCPDSLAFLEAMADQAAVAIDMAALLAQTRTQAQSDERRRLARDLHDSVVQQLFSMRMQAKALRRRLDRADAVGVRGAVEELAELSAGALADLRLLVFELRPLDLAEHGLVAAIEAHAASLRARTGLAIEVHAEADVHIGGGLDFQEDLYRITSEALHNVVKHANATTVEVSIAAETPDLVVQVRDDGASASQSPDRTRERLGLLSMRERTERWGGHFEAGPSADRGWVVRAAVPLLDGEYPP
ncbi:histidine kinase [Actinophytocola sp.]|uniref:PAS domain-containing sensor histidine kinase n=1 Tax=Actinophytocola sp. TaxID=1872138 RepID=UPI00389AC085